MIVNKDRIELFIKKKDIYIYDANTAKCDRFDNVSIIIIIFGASIILEFKNNFYGVNSSLSTRSLKPKLES